MGSACTKFPRRKHNNKESSQEIAGVEVTRLNSTAGEMKDQNQAIQTDTTGKNTEEFVKEFSVCKIDDLHECELKVFNIEEKEVLIVKEQEQIYAMGAYCTHFGAPLKNGIYCQGKVYCPWHGACFNSSTGDIEEFPGLDTIPTYPVSVDQVTNEVKIKITSKNVLNANHGLTKPLCKSDKENKECVVIIGSGAAGHCCAETLRQEGFTGRIVIVTKEKCIPYDRTKLSKAMHLDASKIALRSEEYYTKGDIEFIFGTNVEGVDTTTKSVMLSDEKSLTYNQLVIATGGRPRPIPCPGTHLKNIFLLRSPHDANEIESLANNKEKNVIILGSSFIGMEVAASIVDKTGSVTVVGRDPTPFANIFGEAIGKRIQALHEEKGVKFLMNSEIAELIGDEEGHITEVLLTSGQSLSADLLVAGLGVVPCTEFLRGSEVNQDSRGYIPVDMFMKTNCPDVYAAGDIASFPISRSRDGELHQLASIGHWQMALHHGRTAALSILGRSRPIFETAVPFFWSAMYGKSIRYCGYAPRFDDVVIHGDLDLLKFAAFLCDGDLVKAVVTMNHDPLAVQYAALLRQNKRLLKSQIINDSTSWTQIL